MDAVMCNGSKDRASQDGNAGTGQVGRPEITTGWKVKEMLSGRLETYHRTNAGTEATRNFRGLICCARSTWMYRSASLSARRKVAIY